MDRIFQVKVTPRCVVAARCECHLAVLLLADRLAFARRRHAVVQLLDDEKRVSRRVQGELLRLTYLLFQASARRDHADWDTCRGDDRIRLGEHLARIGWRCFATIESGVSS